MLIEKQCEQIYKNKQLEKGIAFPTCVSVNDMVCHYSPYADESIKLSPGDVVKVDLGCHIDGFIALAANTVIIPSETEEESKKKAIVVRMALFRSRTT